MSDLYELRLFDQKLVSFRLGERSHCDESSQLLRVDGPASLLPLDLDLSDEGIYRWLKRRTIPKNRAYVHNILNSMGLSWRNTKGIIDVYMGLSLNDSYWVVPEGFEGRFSEYNLFQNRFSEALAMTALTGIEMSEGMIGRINSSPEFTTNGMLPKAWRYTGGKVVLFKGGMWRAYAPDPDPLEPFSEYYAAQIADVMGLSPVKYGLSRWKGVFGCTCALFTDKETSYVSMMSLVRKELTDKSPLEYYTLCGEWFRRYDQENDTKLYDYFASILVFDALICNEDRHLGNFGILRDNRSGKIIRNAPIFDNGMSLFNFSSMQELRDIDRHVGAYANHFKQSFEQQVIEFGGKQQIEQLSRLSEFRFKRHSHYNWNPERMAIIQEFIRRRADALIKIL